MRKFFITLLVIFFIFSAFVLGFLFSFLIFKGGNSFTLGEKVAVLEVEGVLFESKPFIQSLTQIRNTDDIKALIVRIDSPGGSVGASQEIYRELLKVKDKKPVVASMGSVGASGGYYLACGANKIFANPGTITGSIGIIAQFVNYEKLAEWAKIDVETIKSGELKDVGSPFREMTEAEREYIKDLMDNVHSQFKQVVSESRGIDSEKVREIADGRVFTGEQAKTLGLVDELGNLGDAVRTAADLAGIEGEPSLIYYPKEKFNILDLLSRFKSEKIIDSLLDRSFGLFYLFNG